MLVNRITSTSDEAGEKLPSMFVLECQVRLQAHTVELSLWHDMGRGLYHG
jgi:hypothetical protein